MAWQTAALYYLATAGVLVAGAPTAGNASESLSNSTDATSVAGDATPVSAVISGSASTSAVAALSNETQAAANGSAAETADKCSTKGLKSLDHIILFMQENRAFDHYFGTMAGVRGFADPNVVISSNTNLPSFYSPVRNGSMQAGMPAPPPGVDYLLPWYFNHEGGDSNDKYQCAISGSNGWEANHQAWNNGTSNYWAEKNTPYSLGYYKRADMPYHWQLAEGWTVGDAYHEGVIASTSPNRIAWITGSIGTEPDKNGKGGPAIDNHEAPGCETTPDGRPYSCVPYTWKTVGEYLEEAGITWQTYQDKDNFGDDPFQYFDQYQNAPPNSSLYQRGASYIGLQRFYDDAKAGKLPQVSFIIGPAQVSEHTPYGPLDGGWFQSLIVDAVTQGKNYDTSALIVSYDETGGWADHVMAPLAPQSESTEWYLDPYNATVNGLQPVGPGYRLPFYIISPYTRNGGVFSEVSTHQSQLLFLEKWAAAKGKPFTLKEMNPYRRKHMSDLTRMFDFSHKDTSRPQLDKVRPSSTNAKGEYNGADTCHAKYGIHQPSVPYGQSEEEALAVEKGFKKVRGNPNIGHYYVFTIGDDAITLNDNGDNVGLDKTVEGYCDESQRWILYAAEDVADNTRFRIQDGGKSGFISYDGTIVDEDAAGVFSITDRSNGKGYEIKADCESTFVDCLKGKIEIFSVSC